MTVFKDGRRGHDNICVGFGDLRMGKLCAVAFYAQEISVSLASDTQVYPRCNI